MPEPLPKDYILGIDLGSNSLGWAVIEQADGQPTGLARVGVRIFEAAMDGNLAEGREESKNRMRREARLHRRQLWRKARRLHKLFNLLQRFALLPDTICNTPDQRQDLLNALDDSIRQSAWFAGKRATGQFPEPDHVLPYIIRASALDEAIEPHMIGRAIYHLAQRRGFLSNRRQVRPQADEDEGQVKQGISELRAAMAANGARTLGEHFARSSPSERRIRKQWTARDMYLDEFAKICDSQAGFHPGLVTADRRTALFHAIFDQRPLKFDKNSIGRCELEPSHRRAPAHLLLSQRFRLLDKVNNLLVDGTPLVQPDREKLVRELELFGDLSFIKIRKLLGIPKAHELNLERGGDKGLPGNRTFAKFYAALAEPWLKMGSDQRERLVEYVNSFQNPEKIEQAAKKKWSLDDDSARKLAAITLEPDYFSLSLKAMRKLLPLLEQGIPLATARKQAYPDALKPKEPLALLPPVADLGEIRNPAVVRSLTELRKVINALVRTHGKPAEIRIELARELKKPKWAREQATKRNRDNEKARSEAKKRIAAEIGIPHPSRTDIRKVLLADECGWHCPYTGRQISMRSLFSEPQFDIEHIIPFSRSLDDSFTNVTLCAIDENRNRKGNQTPFEAYSGDAGRYEEILARVQRFSGDRSTAAAKLRRFRMSPEEVESMLSDFSSRQLADTAYSSRLASRYLGRLYGGVVDASGRRRVQATSGHATAYLRDEWKLNGILNDGATTSGGDARKTRDDHRHHAIDAVAIGLTDAAAIKALSDAAQRAPAERRRRFGSVAAPWPHFVESVRSQIETVVVSHRVSKKVSGALHEETVYSASADSSKERRVRKPLASLTKAEVESICDSAVKALVLAKLSGREPKKAFPGEQNLPFFAASDGRQIPIKRVRISKPVPTLAIGEGRRTRHVASESNHHIEIFAELDDRENEVEWDGCAIPLAEAYRRLRAGEPVICRDHGPNRRFKFSLCPGDTVEWSRNGVAELFVVRGASENRIFLVRSRDARLKDAMVKAKDGSYTRPSVNALRGAIRKIAVSPLGDVSYAND